MMPELDISGDGVLRAYVDDMITKKGVTDINPDQRARLREKLIGLYDERMQKEMIAALPDQKILELESFLAGDPDDGSIEKFFDECGVDFGLVSKKALTGFSRDYLSGALEVEIPESRPKSTDVPDIVDEEAGQSGGRYPAKPEQAEDVAVDDGSDGSVEEVDIAKEVEAGMSEGGSATTDETAKSTGVNEDLEEAIRVAEESVKGVVTPLNGGVSLGGGIVLPEPVAVKDEETDKMAKPNDADKGISHGTQVTQNGQVTSIQSTSPAATSGVQRVSGQEQSIPMQSQEMPGQGVTQEQLVAQPNMTQPPVTQQPAVQQPTISQPINTTSYGAAGGAAASCSTTGWGVTTGSNANGASVQGGASPVVNQTVNSAVNPVVNGGGI